MLRRELYYFVDVVVRRRFVSAYRAAFSAFMRDYVAFFRVGFCAYRVHYSPAVRSSVSGINVKVKGGEAFRAVISAGITERLDLISAVFADEALVYFGKSLFFHLIPLFFLSR